MRTRTRRCANDYEFPDHAAHLRHTTGQTSTYLVTIVTKLELVDRQEKTIWQNPAYTFRQQYEQSQDLASYIQEDSAATRRLAREFAQAAVADILESF